MLERDLEEKNTLAPNPTHSSYMYNLYIDEDIGIVKTLIIKNVV